MKMRRRSAAGVLAAAVAAMTVGCSETGRSDIDLDEIIATMVGSMSPEDGYRDPRKAERQVAREALGLLLGSAGSPKRAGELLREIGYGVTRGVDTRDGRRFVLFLAGADTGWAGLVVDPAKPIRSVIAVPHPAFDLNTEKLGLSLYRALPGSTVLIAGAHRQAGGGKADVAHNDRSMFQTFSVALAERGVPQVQLHGFAQLSLPGADAVVSTGSAPHNDLAVQVARRLKADELRVCRAWVSHCVGLEGTTNVQAVAAAENDAEFVHLELGWPLRRDAAGRDRVRDAVVAAWSG